jgi:apolipoprotein N-acyltransferase
VQPNIEQNLKWDPLHAQDTLDEIQRIVSHEYVDLMVFPESVFPIVWEQLPVNYRKNLIAMARDKHMSILAGVMMRKPYLANASMLITEDRFPWQAKHHLVPFGEYVPLPWLTQWIYRYLNIPFSDIQEGSPTRHPIRTLGQALGTHICYENGFGDELMSLNRQSSILVNLSNLAWFGRSHALGQHLQISQSRALESGRYLIQATNNGATAVINDRGHIIATTPFHQKAILKHYVEGRQHDTPYLIWGSWPVLIWSWIVILLSLGIRRFYKGVKS